MDFTFFDSLATNCCNWPFLNVAHRLVIDQVNVVNEIWIYTRAHKHTYTWILQYLILVFYFTLLNSMLEHIQVLLHYVSYWIVDPAPLGPDRNDDISKLIFRYLA